MAEREGPPLEHELSGTDDDDHPEGLFGSALFGAGAEAASEHEDAAEEEHEEEAADVAVDAERPLPEEAARPVGIAARNALFLQLDLANGQDAYDVTSEALGRIQKNEYLQVPVGVRVIDAKNVGMVEAKAHLTDTVFAQIFAANQLPTVAPEYRNKFALLRAMAVEIGWYAKQSETSITNVGVDAQAAFIAVSDEIASLFDIARRVAYLVPFATEFIFRTSGHHFLSSMSADYVSKYAKIFASCLCPEVAGYLPPELLYHASLHWVSPARVRAVLKAKVGLSAKSIPDAIRIRVDASPSGTAIVTTTVAVLDAMTGSGIKDQLAIYGKFAFDKLEKVSKDIKAKPESYHKAYYAYKVAGLSAEEKSELEDAVAEAIRFAPYAKGFTTAMFGDVALGQAKVFDKHAANDPIATKRSATLFRKIAKTGVEKIEDLFVSTPGEEE